MKTVLVVVKMILIIVITVSIGSVLGTIGYLTSIKNFPPVIIQPTIAPTATSAPNIDISDWNTYKNEKYGFEIKYPNNWFAEDSNSETIPTIILAVIGTKENPNYVYSYGLFNIENDAFIVIHTNKEDWNEPIDNFGGDGTLKQKNVLDNAETMKEYYNGDLLRYVIKKDKTILDLEIRLPNNPKEKKIMEKIINQIISTIKLIEK